MLSGIAATRGAPQRIYCAIGGEFQSRQVDLRAYTQKV